MIESPTIDLDTPEDWDRWQADRLERHAERPVQPKRPEA